MSVDVVELPGGERHALAMEIGKAFGTPTQPEAEFPDIEVDRTLDIFHQQADVGDAGEVGRHDYFVPPVLESGSFTPTRFAAPMMCVRIAASAAAGSPATSAS